MKDEEHDITIMLEDWHQGDQAAGDAVVERLMPEIRKRARIFLAKERFRPCQTTALVNDAFARLMGHLAGTANRSHFLALVAIAMRRILVDRARKRPPKRLETLVEAPAGAQPVPGILALHDALDDLTRIAPRQGRAIEMKHFGGMTAEESAAVLGVSVRTVERDLHEGRAWLRRQLQVAAVA